MASLPDPLYVLLSENRYFRVDHAASATDVDVTNYKAGDTYRNELSGAYVGGANINPDLEGGGGDPGSYFTDFKAKDDNYNATPPHATPHSRTERQFVGSSRTFTGTTVTGTANITMPDTSLLSVGMPIAGTGIPTGSLISKITSETVIIITQVATASGTVICTIGSNVDIIARCWVDEFVKYSAYPPQLLGRSAILWPAT